MATPETTTTEAELLKEVKTIELVPNDTPEEVEQRIKSAISQKREDIAQFANNLFPENSNEMKQQLLEEYDFELYRILTDLNAKKPQSIDVVIEDILDEFSISDEVIPDETAMSILTNYPESALIPSIINGQKSIVLWKFLSAHPNHPQREALLKILLDKRRINSVDNFLEENPNSEFTLLILQNLHPSIGWHFLSRNPEHFQGKEIVEDLVKRNLWGAIDFMADNPEHPQCQNIKESMRSIDEDFIRKKVQESPNDSFSFFVRNKNHPHIDIFLDEIAKIQPWELLANISHFLDSSNIDNYIDTLFESLKKAEMPKNKLLLEQIVSSEFLLNILSALLGNIPHDNIQNAIMSLSQEKRSKILGAVKQESINFFTQNAEKIKFAIPLIAHNKKTNYDLFITDPALETAMRIQEEWIKSPAPRNKKEMRQYQMMIGRNFFASGTSIDEQNVKNEYREILQRKESLKNTPLFQGRNVVFAAHSEQRDKDLGDGPRFGRDEIITSIENQGGSVFDIRPKEEEKELETAKQEFLASITDTPPPATFLLRGHGKEDSFYFFGGEIEGVDENGNKIKEDLEVKVSVEEFSQALVARYKNFPELKKVSLCKRDIFVFGACLQTNFIKAVAESSKGKFPMPIMLSKSEYGQYGFSGESDIGSDFLDKTLGLGKNRHISTFGDIFENEWDLNSNPSLFIPSEDNLQQISQKTDRKNIFYT